MNTRSSQFPLCALSLLGCSPHGPFHPPRSTAKAPYVAARDFLQLIKSSTEPVLSEFSVPVGCFRCDQMRPQVESLADQLRGKVKVTRLSLNFERAIAAELGVTVCPTYIVLVNRQGCFA